MTSILSVSELTAKIDKSKSEKAAAAARAKVAEDKEKEQLLERLSHDSSLTKDQLLERAATMIDRAIDANESSVQVFRFPHALCTDNGRAVGQLEAGWESTLVGVPKQIHELWLQHLKPKGYHIRFQILDYPGGLPGDVGIFLSWATERK
jgi:hypothetical protein